MAQNLKPLYQQVMLVTGASSDIGSMIVHRAVEQGMKVFMVDRDEGALQIIQDEMRGKGYDTAYSVADVGEEQQLQFSADQCITTFGIIDTWVNVPGENMAPPKRQFETHYWALVNGCNIATAMLRESGGSIINVASAYRSEVSPGEHIDSASKQAVKGFTDSLRKDLKSVKAPIRVSLIISSSPEVVSQSVLAEAKGPSLLAPITQKIFPPTALPQKEEKRNLVAGAVASLTMLGGVALLLFKKAR